MPTYNFRCNKTDKVWEKNLKISELDDYKKNHKCTIVIGQVNVVGGDRKDHYSRTDGDFKSKMKQIKRDYPSAANNLKDW
jgi:hypothetical protein